MFEKTYRAGDTIFQKGDSPDFLYYLESGRVHLKEIDVYVEPYRSASERPPSVTTARWRMPASTTP